MTTLGNSLAPGFNVKEEDCILLVPSGITTAVGGIYALNTTVITSGSLTTIAAVAAGDLLGIKSGILLVAMEIVVGATGGVPCRFKFASANVPILLEGTTDVVAGDFLKAVDAQAYLVKASGAADRAIAIALAGQTANSAVLTNCMLLGSINVATE